MSEHTPGRLIARGFSIYAADGKTPVADTCLNNSIAGHDVENARRLVACWNACDLMPTEDIERLAAIGEGVMRLSVLADDNRAERDSLRAVNAELMEALQIAVRQNSHDMQMTGDELRRCESAIASARKQENHHG